MALIDTANHLLSRLTFVLWFMYTTRPSAVVFASHPMNTQRNEEVPRGRSRIMMGMTAHRFNLVKIESFGKYSVDFGHSKH